jgi:alkylated DNA repair dioxygenase AlkB
MTIPITYIKDFVSDTDVCFKRLSEELAWVHRDTTPRHEYYVNDFGVPYTYGSGDFARTYEAQPMHAIISYLRMKLEAETKEKYEVCFLNRYLNQSDHLGWHSDNSPEMDDARPIAIISFGVEREIWFRSMEEPKVVSKMKLENGSLCLMHPGMQDTHQHRIPKASFMCGERISLTFRGYVNHG